MTHGWVTMRHLPSHELQPWGCHDHCHPSCCFRYHELGYVVVPDIKEPLTSVVRCMRSDLLRPSRFYDAPVWHDTSADNMYWQCSIWQVNRERGGWRYCSMFALMWCEWWWCATKCRQSAAFESCSRCLPLHCIRVWCKQSAWRTPACCGDEQEAWALWMGGCI